jgi:hypothetical protein
MELLRNDAWLVTAKSRSLLTRLPGWPGTSWLQKQPLRTLSLPIELDQVLAAVFIPQVCRGAD